MQDVLGLPTEARMNTPGTVSESNWTWRLTPEQINAATAKELKREALTFCRCKK
jgi:4-alpha-glucanotransferase